MLNHNVRKLVHKQTCTNLCVCRAPHPEIQNWRESDCLTFDRQYLMDKTYLLLHKKNTTHTETYSKIHLISKSVRRTCLNVCLHISQSQWFVGNEVQRTNGIYFPQICPLNQCFIFKSVQKSITQKHKQRVEQ